MAATAATSSFPSLQVVLSRGRSLTKEVSESDKKTAEAVRSILGKEYSEAIFSSILDYFSTPITRINPGEIDRKIREVTCFMFGGEHPNISDCILDYYYSRFAVYPPGFSLEASCRWVRPDDCLVTNAHTIGATSAFVYRQNLCGLLNFRNMEYQTTGTSVDDFYQRAAGDQNWFFYVWEKSITYCYQGFDVTRGCPWIKGGESVGIVNTNNESLCAWQPGTYFRYHSPKQEFTIEIARGVLLLSRSPNSARCFYDAAVTIETGYQTPIIHAETILEDRVVIVCQNEMGIWDLKTREFVIKITNAISGDTYCNALVAGNVLCVQRSLTSERVMFSLPTFHPIHALHDDCFLTAGEEGVFAPFYDDAIRVYSSDWLDEIASFETEGVESVHLLGDSMVVSFGHLWQRFQFSRLR